MTKLELARMIDHTLLKPDATAEQIKALCREAVEHHFCSVCVNSGRAALAKECIQGSDVKLCVVVGFPLGCSVTKAAEARAVAELGADEIDMVLDVGLAKDGAWDQVQADIAAVRAACPRQTLKVILETCLLTREEIVQACEAAKNAGADFVKTSTGFSTAGAKKEDVALMKAAAGGLLVKASGGIHSYEEAMEMIDAGASRIGASAGIAIIAGLEETMENVKSVILAAGKGTRLQSEQYQLPKVLREANGQPLLHYVLEALDFLPVSESIVVVGYMREKVMEAFPDYPYAIQDEQKGTGHAVQCARGLLEDFDGTVLVCCGDMPLIKKETYRALLETHMAQGNACTFLTGTCTDDLPYGRILRDQEGNFLRVVEDKDCTPEQKKIRELNAGVYAFDCKELLSCLNLLKNENAQGEYYLTDVPELIRKKGGKIGICCVELNEQIIGVNTVEQLRQVEEYLRNR